MGLFFEVGEGQLYSSQKYAAKINADMTLIAFDVLVVGELQDEALKIALRVPIGFNAIYN